MPLARSIALALPKVRLMRPWRGSSTLASYASRFSSLSMVVLWLSSAPSGAEALSEVIIDLIAAQILLERRQFSVGADQRQLNSGDGGEVFQHFRRDGVAETRVVRAAGQNPRRASALVVRPALPHRARDWQLRQLRVLDDVDLVDHQTEAVAEVDQAGVERRPRRGVEHQAHRVFLAADAERMDLERRLAAGDARRDLEHMRAEHLPAPALRQTVSVVFHERGAARQA